MLESLKKNYSIVSPSYNIEYSYSGTIIEISVGLFIRANGKSGIPGKTYNLILDYNEGTKNWNTYSKLWASASKYSLSVERGINTVDFGVLNLPYKKMLMSKPDEQSLSQHILEGICTLNSSGHIYPIIGTHCHNCYFQVPCSRLLSE
jgi:hypothetical protein